MAFVTTCIDTALSDLKLLENIMVSKISGDLSWNEYRPVKLLRNKILTLMPRLRNIRIFILCLRKVSNNVHLVDANNKKVGSLGSLLVRIEEVVCKNAEEIHPYLSFEVGLTKDVTAKIEQFAANINSFKEEIEECYNILADFLQQLISSTTDEVVGITDCVLERLMDFLKIFAHPELVLVVESLVEKIKFLKSFICFVMLQGVENQKLEDLLNHIEVVVVNAAGISFKLQYDVVVRFDIEWSKVMQSQVSILLQKIKPIDPHICATYTQALTSSKLSRQLHAPISDMDADPKIIMKDFIDYLVCNLWEMLLLDTYPLDSVKDQLQVLHGGLRFLRTILVQQPNKFDESIIDFIGVLICDAGIIIFLHYQKDIKIDTELQDLLQKIEHIRKQVEEKDPDRCAFNFCSTNELGFIDYLTENLTDMTRSKAASNGQSFAQTIREQFVFLRSVLVEIVDLHSEQEELRTLRDHVMEVAYRVESLIDQLVVGDTSSSFIVLFDSVVEDINNIKTNALKIITGKKQDMKMNEVSKKSSYVPKQSSSPKVDEVVGFDDESTSITNRLTRGSKQLRIIAIVGMPGQGKTTLATKLYHCNTVMHHFYVHSLCSISQVFNKRNVLLELVNHIVIKPPERYFAMTEQDLAEELWRHLKGKRYLIFLDDVWDIQVWNSLAESLPDDSNGSRIILTSRLHDVVPHAMLDEEPHLLRELTIDESWELLRRKLSLAKGCDPELYELGKQIAENCKGLPLTIVIVAGLLANMEQEKWNEILESLRSGNIAATPQFMNILELSYKHLPYYLKPCFLYFGMFPEDQEVSKRTLIWLWIAEGFVQKIKLRSIEDVATDYLMDLISRSLVLVAKQRSIGGVKACRVHDLLHDFCMTKAKEENFFKLLRGYDELLAFDAPSSLRRLSIQSESRHFKESRLLCPRIRSLLFFNEEKWLDQRGLDISFIIHISKLLRVLDIGQIDLGSIFPNEISLLVQLRYLAVQGILNVIPSSIGNLLYLESFIVNAVGEMVSFPNTLWKLRKLRHIGVVFGGFSFAIDNLEDSSGLYELESCSGMMISSWDSMEKQLKKFPNIRKLKCKLFQNWDEIENCNRIVLPDFLTNLQSLGLFKYEERRRLPRIGSHIEPTPNPAPWIPLRKRIDFEFGLPANLKKLTLSEFGLPWSKISSIGKLPNLEVLKLLSGSFSGEIWDMEEGEFSRLRFLKLASLELVGWISASYDQFPHLRKLVVQSCNFLKEFPSCLENTLTLEMIELSQCLRSLTNLVKQIQEEQMDMGNSDLKILVREEFEDRD